MQWTSCNQINSRNYHRNNKNSWNLFQECYLRYLLFRLCIIHPRIKFGIKKVKYIINIGKDIVNGVNNIVGIVRKSLLNFCMIALMTTLYPNLTMTTDNSDCFKAPNNKECHITIIGLLVQKVFIGPLVTTISLFVLLIYISYSAYMIISLVV